MHPQRYRFYAPVNIIEHKKIVLDGMQNLQSKHHYNYQSNQQYHTPQKLDELAHEYRLILKTAANKYIGKCK